MLLSNLPSRIVAAFAGSGNKRTVPVASQIGVTAGAASFTDGFPPLNATKLEAGGVPPSIQDMNGILYAITQVQRWQCGGGLFPYDSTWSSTNGGYPKGALLLKADGSGHWLNTLDGNTSNPDTGGSNWTSYGGVKTVKTVVFTSGGTYTPSAGLLFADVQVIGGGGGGGGATAPGNSGTGGSGGGAGGYSRKLLSAATVGASQTVTIGTGGAGATSSGAGSAGGTSSFGSLLSASGGAGGTWTGGGPWAIVSGGDGGTSSGGDLNVGGGSGGVGGGGYSSGEFSVGHGGQGGNSFLGGGGRGGASQGTGPGGAGLAYGAGGGGGAASQGGPAAGGNGSPGVVIITEYCSL